MALFFVRDNAEIDQETLNHCCMQKVREIFHICNDKL
jgi:hypothetical protein